MFQGRLIEDKKGSPTRSADTTVHWLRRILVSRSTKIDEDPDLSYFFEQFHGPGGLPALPLLDYAIHEKIMVVDGKYAVVGGRNMEEQYFTHWIDLDLYIEGDLVHDIQRSFLTSFKKISLHKENVKLPREVFQSLPAENGLSAQFVKSRPWDHEYNTLISLVHAIQSCKDYFYAGSQYLILPDSLLHDAIINAAERGVDVRILTNSFHTSKNLNFAGGFFSSMNYLDDLISAGVRVYELRGLKEMREAQPYYHVKEFLFDGKLAAVGSFNLSLRSSYIESENLVFINDGSFQGLQYVAH